MRPTAALVLTLLLAACADSSRPCPHQGKADFAPSGGCLAVVHGKILLIENLARKVSPPGGKSLQGESAQCTAHRETYEEIGLDLVPGRLLHVFDTGFHLYHCQIHAESGQIKPAVLEARRAIWLPVTDVDDVEWRFPGQGAALRTILNTPYQQLEQE